MSASESRDYLERLAEGIDMDSEEGKLMRAMIDVMACMAKDIEDLEATVADMSDYVENIREDIEYVEDLALSGREELSDEEQEGCSGDCSACGGCAEFEVTCPACGTVIPLYREDIEFGSIICPNCREELQFENEEE